MEPRDSRLSHQKPRAKEKDQRLERKTQHMKEASDTDRERHDAREDKKKRGR